MKLIFSTINKKQFLLLIKATLMTIILTLWQFIPFITDYLGKNIVAPNEVFQFPYGFNNLINNSFQNTADTNGRIGIGILLIMVLLIGWAVPIVQRNKKELIIYSLGVLILLCSTTFLAWQAFGSNKAVLNTLGNLQMTFRLLPYGSLFLSVTASFILNSYINNLNLGQREVLVLALFTLISVGGYYGSIQNEVQLLFNPSANLMLNKMDAKEKKPIAMNKLVDKKNYKDIFDYQILFGETDYYNKKAINHSKSIINNWTYINEKKQIIEKFPQTNKITMQIRGKQNEEANLPIIAYNNTIVTNNGRKTNYQLSNRGTVQIKLHNGTNNVIVKYEMNIYYYILFIVAIIGWIVLIVSDFRDRFIRK